MSCSELTEEEQRSAIITTITLDISNKHLKEVPKTIKNFSNIEFLYLSTNDIKTVPDHFFISLPQLKWLDFRHNLLTSLPTSIGQHRELRTLLLQGNEITRLPIELGNVPTITGLNIAGNPLEYPPTTVLQEGTHEILKYLRLELQRECLLIPELVEQLEDVHITEKEGYLGCGEEDGRVLEPVKRASRIKCRIQNIESPLSQTSARLLLRGQGRKWSTNGTIITTKPKLPKTRRKFKSANPVARVRHSDYYMQKISQAIKDYEEERMQAIKKEENSKTEMMVQRMRAREALKMWRQQTYTQNDGSTVTSRESVVKRLDRPTKCKPSLEDMIGYIGTQIEALRSREHRMCSEGVCSNSYSTEVLKLRGIIERKEVELLDLELRRKRIGENNSKVLLKSNTLDSIRPLRQKAGALTGKELALRNKIKEHASKLREYHKSGQQKKTQARANYDEMRQLNEEYRSRDQEYRFKAFTGEITDDL